MIVKIKKSKEQKQVLTAVGKYENIKVRALAGTGKTTTLTMLAESNPDERILYLVFNNANKKEAETRFPRNTHAKTTHSLAYQAVKQNTNIDLRQVRKNYKAKEIADLYNVNFEVALGAIHVFEAFCNSHAHQLEEISVEESGKIARKMFGDMQSNKIPCTHSFYIKYFHLLLIHKELSNSYSMAMIDEAQDTNMVTLDIFKRLNIEKKIYVGDEHQQIYAFRGSKDIMRYVDGLDLSLTETFRFNEDIASTANLILKRFKGDDLKIKTNVKKDLGNLKTHCYISRTNSSMIDTMNDFILSNVEFKTIRNPEEIFSLVVDVYYFGKEEYSKIKNHLYLKKFKNLQELEEYAESTDDVELLTSLKIIENYGDKIFEIKKIARNYFLSNKEFKTFLSTAHVSKGMEWDEVSLTDDFPDFLKKIAESKYKTLKGFRNNIDSIDPLVVNEFNLFYVAVTRAKQKLNILSHNKEYLELPEKELDGIIKGFKAKIKT